MKPGCRILILILSFALAWRHAVAQTYIERNYTVKDGLPSNYVYSVIQDHNGFLWFATNNGVSRFDGKEFKNFTAANGLPDNDIVNLVEDAVGRIWLSCFNAVPCYIRHNRVVAGDSICKKVQIADNSYFRFATLGRKVLITSAVSREGTLVAEDGTLSSMDLGAQGEMLAVDSFIIPLYKVYIGQLVVYKGSKVSDTMALPFQRRVSMNESPVIICSPSSWGNGRFALFMKDRQCYRYQLSGGRISFLDQLTTLFPVSKIYNYHQQLWAQVNNDSIVPVNMQFAPDRSRQTLFRNKMIQYFFVDNEENAWACTAGNGVYMIPARKVQLYETKNGLLSNNIHKLFALDKELYMGFNNTDIQVFRHGAIHLVAKEPTFAQGKMRCLYASRDYILFSALNNGFVLSKSNNKCLGIPGIPAIKCVRASRDKGVWIGTSGKCFKLSLPDKVTDTISCGRVNCLLERSDGVLLAGTQHGILTCSKDSTQRWHVDTFRAPLSLKDLSISFIEAYGNILVIGTTQKGLLLIQGNEYEFAGKNSGILRNANCKAISVDESRDVIWVATFSGLYKIRLKGNIHRYDIEDVSQRLGLPGLDINDFTIMNDTVYIAGSQGLVVFPADNTVFSRHTAPLVYINDVVVNDTLLLMPQQEFSLRPGENNVQFNFSGIDYKSRGNILFRYRLHGLRDDWQYTNQNSIRYESLPPGTYRFEMQAMNAEQIWSRSGAALSFSIQPFWWQSNLFLAFALLLFTLAVLIVSRSLLLRQHRILLSKASTRRHIAEVELKALKAQINPHFIFNTLNAIQYFVTNGKAALADSYLGKLSKLLRKTLDFSSKTSVSLEEEIRYIDNYLQLEQLRFEDNFRYTIENSVPAEKAQIPIPPMVLQPHIENALRHAFKGMQQQEKWIAVRFRIAGNELICEVEDNGVGRKASVQGKAAGGADHVSHGQELSSSKLDIYEQLTGKKGKTTIIDKGQGGGTRGTLVIITLAL